ncbi:PKD domain-containing protein [Haloarcula sp. CBA1130]|uniref:PKD domain-containing protein n=1 Tax=unclassified Haloarcula TaxID=2624677 RepID=UPI0012493EE4|nr:MULTISPECIES: PKD domain-containing protein [unclassified Haloarcula]KAA9397300.1 PKD domain-containing protein [Haloarcula sp. CBA1129]KAA9402664.1 PKD domain-containing protein [Haloarcula sp. CBA1130]
MSANGYSRVTPMILGSPRRWLPLLALLLAVPLLMPIATSTVVAEDTEPPVWGNATRGDDTTIEVTIYDDESIDTNTIQASDFTLTAGDVENVSVTSISAAEGNKSGARVSLLLADKVDKNNVSVGLRNTANITDTAGNKLPDGTVTATGMDAVVPKYRDFNVTRVNSSTAEITVETHERLDQLRISVGGAALDTLNISGFTERTGNSAVYTREYTFPEEGEYSLLLMSVRDRHGNNNSFSRQRTFLYDGTGPNVTVAGPENATVGESVTFSAAETTDDQGVASIQWQVGDDTILTGENITVAFASPGNHEVAVTATDPFGNTETVTRTVSVTGNGTAGNVTVQQPNATVATVSVNGTGQAQLIEPRVGALTSGPNGTLERLTATFPRNESATLTIRSRQPTPSFVAANNHTGVSQFDIDHGSVRAEDVTFTFTVDRDTLAAVASEPSAVTLFRNGDGWTPLATEIVTQSESHIVYRAVSPGFSTFVVGVERPTTADTDPETEANGSETPTPTPETTETPTEDTGKPDIVVTNATAVPSTLGPGDRTVITVELENRGTASGDHNVIVSLNTSVLTTRTVTVPAGETRTTEFARSVPENRTGGLTVDGQRVGNVTGDSGGLPIPALPSIGVPNPLSLWPDGIIGTALGGLLGVAIGLYGVLKALAIYLGY